MNYYLDTEFHEYQRKPLSSKPFRTIELISIGIVSEDDREYYAISKDFDLKAAWNSYQMEKKWVKLDESNSTTEDVKEYWLRENVLNPIWIELHKKELGDKYKREQLNVAGGPDPCKDFFSYRSLKRLLKKYGKSNTQIAKEVIDFCSGYKHPVNHGIPTMVKDDNIQFYAYYADYDWVVFCWLFGKMIDLPKGFPKYCRDLKQTSDDVYDEKKKSYYENSKEQAIKHSGVFLDELSDHPDYPQQSNEHNALADAKWNKELHKCIDLL